MTNPFGPTPGAPAPGNPFGPAPMQQAPAPQAYAPATQQQSPQQAPQAYGVPGQPGSSQWPAGAQPAAAPGLGSFNSPSAATTGGGQGASLVAMYGRLVLVLPQRIERGLRSNFVDPKTNQPRLQDRMTATFVVLDGSNPIPFGGNPYSMPPVAHTKSEPLPHVSKGLWVSQAKLIEQCDKALTLVEQRGPGGDAMVLGRLLRNGPEANAAWILADPSDEDTRVATYYLQGVQSGQFPNPLQ